MRVKYANIMFQEEVRSKIKIKLRQLKYWNFFWKMVLIQILEMIEEGLHCTKLVNQIIS